ncbi:Fe3+ hydroxamate ABC transporter substrate-binding protein [Sporosarcina sp. FA9]|uniref:Fe3+ hydroxamate ABC transporter substrate-binding protein n=1 Tax=Sporosarcina sp. FA9 TaxID=3413030 RepID=UPI003F65A8DC
MFKRKLYCTNCNREIEDDEEIYAKMKVPKHSIMVEIKAYLKKKSEIFCTACFEQIK